MKRKILFIMLLTVMFSAIPFIKVNAETYRYEDTLERESTIYVGDVIVDGVERINYVYSDDIVNVYPIDYGKSVFDTVEEFLPLKYARLIPKDAEVNQEGMAYSSLHQDEMDETWKNASNVASKYYITGIQTDLVNENLYNVDENFKADIDEEDIRRQSKGGMAAEGRILTSVEYTRQGNTSIYSYIHKIDAVTVIYTSVNVQTTPKPNYSLTYYSYDGINTLRVLSRNTVEEDIVIEEPAEVPTLQGYFFDKWRDLNGNEINFPITIKYNTRVYASWFRDIVDLAFVMRDRTEETVSADTDIEEYINSKQAEFERQIRYFETKYNEVNMPAYSQLFSTGGTAYRYAIYNGYNLRSIVSTEQIDPFTRAKTDEADVLYTIVTVHKEGEGPLYVKGDINADTFVNSADAAIVLDKFKGEDATFDDYDRGDMNEDNILNSTDAAMILDIFKSSNQVVTGGGIS